jgi:hypothetical protein
MKAVSLPDTTLDGISVYCVLKILYRSRDEDLMGRIPNIRMGYGQDF